MNAQQQWTNPTNPPSGWYSIAAGYLEQQEISIPTTPLDYAKGQALAKHYKQLSEMVSELLVNGLDTVEKNDPSVSEFPYTLWSGQSGIMVSKEILTSYLQENINQLHHKYNDFDLQNLMYHLEAEYPDISSKGLRKIVVENPYELIDILRLLVRKKMSKGNCSECKNM